MGREFPEHPVVGVGAVVLRRCAQSSEQSELEVLLVRRANPPLQGEWSLPGGVVELGESLEDAVRREVYEETALHVALHGVVEVFDTIHRTGDGRVQFHYVLIDYICSVRSGSMVAASDATDVCWRALRDLSESGSEALRAYTIQVIRRAATRFCLPDKASTPR